LGFKNKFPRSAVIDELTRQIQSDLLSAEEVSEEVLIYIKNELLPRLQENDATWEEFATFWPPRCVTAAKENNAVVFFGSGLSMPCGIPTWNGLLSETFGLEESLTSDKDLSRDPLTLAELASQYIGSEVLQSMLRDEMLKQRKHSVNHALICALRFPYYITTNYDLLFEQAWKEVNNPSDLVVVTNDGDLLSNDFKQAWRKQHSILYKIHGSADRESEHMILTRKDYRSHYRINNDMFLNIRKLLKEKHIVFLGFSHNDPEVSRLVDDAIFEFEKNKNRKSADPRPQFYSLQFDMKDHTPEIFAARGIVTLKPPIVKSPLEQVKTKSLAIALSDLLIAQTYDLHESASFDKELRQAENEISKELEKGLTALKNNNSNAKNYIDKKNTNLTWIRNLRSSLGHLASQGVYLTDEFGKCLCWATPSRIRKRDRILSNPINERPYFRQSKSFREPFVSDFAESIFNNNSTFFICYPILKVGKFFGLLFSAAQIGQWKKPINLARKHWGKGQSFLILDSNGVCGLPPHDEFSTEIPNTKNGIVNEGYPHKKLLSVSRRDSLIKHISKSVVPVTQDDDVLRLSGDFSQFTVVSEIDKTRWKIGISIPIQTKYEWWNTRDS